MTELPSSEYDSTNNRNHTAFTHTTAIVSRAKSNRITCQKQSYHVPKAIVSRAKSNRITCQKQSYHVPFTHTTAVVSRAKSATARVLQLQI